MCKLAVVILNWNGIDMLLKYLPSVIQCSKGEGIDVIVADNASTDDSVNILHSEFPNVRIIQLDKNYGFAEGYNRALGQVEAEYYLLLNSDVEIKQQGWLNPMLSYMDNHPDVAVCQPKLLKLFNEDSMFAKNNVFEYAGAAGGFIDRYGYPYCRGRIFATVEEDKGQYDEIVLLMWATGAAMMVRSKLYWAAGGLDKKFFAHMEEIDLCWRIRIMGYKIVCVTDSIVFHLGGATLHQGNPKKTYLNFRNNLVMLYKNLPESELNSVLQMRRVLDFIAALQSLLNGDFANMVAIFKAYKDFKKMKLSYKEIRYGIQTNRRQSSLPDHTSISILWQYYIKGRRTFDRI